MKGGEKRGGREDEKRDEKRVKRMRDSEGGDKNKRGERRDGGVEQKSTDNQ